MTWSFTVVKKKWLQIMVIMFKMNKRCIAKSMEYLDIVPMK